MNKEKTKELYFYVFNDKSLNSWSIAGPYLSKDEAKSVSQIPTICQPKLVTGTQIAEALELI